MTRTLARNLLLAMFLAFALLLGSAVTAGIVPGLTGTAVAQEEDDSDSDSDDSDSDSDDSDSDSDTDDADAPAGGVDAGLGGLAAIAVPGALAVGSFGIAGAAAVASRRRS